MRRYIVGVLLAAAVMAGLGYLQNAPSPEMPALSAHPSGGLDAVYQKGTDAVLQDLADRSKPPASR